MFDSSLSLAGCGLRRRGRRELEESRVRCPLAFHVYILVVQRPLVALDLVTDSESFGVRNSGTVCTLCVHNCRQGGGKRDREGEEEQA